MTIAELNASDRQQFVDALGWIFEGSPWVADRTWRRRPFGSVAALHAAMMDEVAGASREQQLALLRAHPDLGARASMSDASTAEQAGAGLDRLGVKEFERLRELTSAYREKFGFPFLLAVKGASKADVLRALESRLSAAPDQEWIEALTQVGRIARSRLPDILGS